MVMLQSMEQWAADRNLTGAGASITSNKEKLLQYIINLTNEEADKIISRLKEFATVEEILPLLPLCNSSQE